MKHTVLITPGNGYRTLALNRPDRLNAINEEMLVALKAAIDDADEDEDCRALILTGSGRGFCAGQDLSDRLVTFKPGHQPDIKRALGELYNALVRRLHTLRMPVICAVNGTAAGAGANIALTCDIVLAAKSAKFLQAFARIGLLPDAGGTWILPRLVGAQRARGLALLAEAISAEQAETWGLIWKAIDDDKLMTEANALAGRLATQPTQAFAATKRALDASETNTLEQQLALERELQHALAGQPDYAEGVNAFFERRAPKFTGRKK
jgi:2-(1,2-epoxy-1,2-dihydrophenyl)acetyl-CoA isomerase